MHGCRRASVYRNRWHEPTSALEAWHARARTYGASKATVGRIRDGGRAASVRRRPCPLSKLRELGAPSGSGVRSARAATRQRSARVRRNRAAQLCWVTKIGGGVNVCARYAAEGGLKRGRHGNTGRCHGCLCSAEDWDSSSTGTGHRSYRLTSYDCLDFSLPMTRLAARKATLVNINRTELPGRI